MHILRTPDHRFEDLPDFPFSPHYVEIPSGDGTTHLRMHFLDEGPADAPVVLMLHGEPSWCFLYRKVIPAVVAAGMRAVAPDLIGFGRSDKPAAREDYTYARHVGWVRAFIETLALRDLTLLCQDWGGLIGLRLVAEMGDRFSRVVAANTGLPTGEQQPSEAFLAWRRFSQEAPVMPVGAIVRSGCARGLSPEAVAAYEAPFPDGTYQAGARQFPLLVPASPDDPATESNRAAWEALRRFEKPFLTLFGDSDPITAGSDRAFQKKVPGAAGQPHERLLRAGHFLQEDVGAELGAAVAAFVRR